MPDSSDHDAVTIGSGKISLTAQKVHPFHRPRRRQNSLNPRTTILETLPLFYPVSGILKRSVDFLARIHRMIPQRVAHFSHNAPGMPQDTVDTAIG